MVISDAVGMVFFAGFIGSVAFYTYRSREYLDDMCCMMTGMVFGTATGFAVGVLYALATRDYLWATIIGSVIGVVVGLPFGRLGGTLGRLEGIMGGVMGGNMGAMIGFMMFPFDLNVFRIFFYAVMIVFMVELAYLVYKMKKKGKSCCVKAPVHQVHEEEAQMGKEEEKAKI